VGHVVANRLGDWRVTAVTRLNRFLWLCPFLKILVRQMRDYTLISLDHYSLVD
jgi:hypothetical protein